MPREFLHQDEGRAQIGLEVAVPAFARRRERVVVLEDRGVVDEAAERTQRLAPPRGHQIRDLGLAREIGGERHGSAAGGRISAASASAAARRAAVMHRHRPAVSGEFQGDGAADALGRRR